MSQEPRPRFGATGIGVSDLARSVDFQRIREAGLPVEREPEPIPELANAIVGFARDPDGYRIEILEARPVARA